MAEEVKQGEIRVAEADRDKVMQVANATKEREIGTREASREQAVRVAELEKEQTVGEQTAAFQRDVSVKDAEQAKRIAVAEANAKRSTAKTSPRPKIAQSQATLLEQKAEAYQLGEGRKREAEAAVLEVQNRAMAKAALAEAERVEAEQRAKLEAPAKAQKARIVVDAEAEAEKRKLEAQGEASAIFAKLEAEARGQYEILAKKGEGLKQIIEACGGAQQAFQLLMLEHLDKLAETSAQGHQQYQVRQDRRVGKWRRERPLEYGRLSPQDGRHPATDAASDARYRRRRNPRKPGETRRRRRADGSYEWSGTRYRARDRWGICHGDGNAITRRHRNERDGRIPSRSIVVGTCRSSD